MIGFFLISTLLLLISVSLPLGVYLGSWFSWIKYVNNCLEIFAKQSIFLKQFPLILKFHWYKCLALYLFYLCFFVLFCLGFYFFVSYMEEIENIYVFIPIISGILLYVIISLFCFKKTWKEMSKLGIYNRQTALTLFKSYQDEFVNSLAMPTIKKIELFNDQNLRAMIDSPFQFNQRRYKRKVQRLKKRLNGKFEEKYQYQLLKIYINYLKTYAIFFKRIQNLNKVSVYVGDYVGTTHFFIEEERYDDFEVLKAVLIGNFFAFAN